MPEYIDGFVIPVPKKKLEAYRKIAKKAGKIWMDHGALSYYETVGDDMKTKMGIGFPQLAQIKPNETVIFAWIVYKSRKHRDAVNKKVMNDARMKDMFDANDKIFDCNKMSYGGFETIVKY